MSKIASFETLFVEGPFGHEKCLHTKPALGKKNLEYKCLPIFCLLTLLGYAHGLRTPRVDKAFTAQPKIHYHSQILRYGRSKFCLPFRPNISDIFDICLHWVSVVRGYAHVCLHDLMIVQNAQCNELK